MNAAKIIVNNHDGTPLITLFTQEVDPSPNGIGVQLAAFLYAMREVRGIPVDEWESVFNGMGDLAVRLVTFLKGENHWVPGTWYILTPDEIDTKAEYTYHINPVEDTPPGRNEFAEVMTYVFRREEQIFEGSATKDDFIDFVVTYGQPLPSVVLHKG